MPQNNVPLFTKDGLRTNEKINFNFLKAQLIERYEAAQIGRRNPHYVPSGNGTMPSAGNGLLPSTAAPTITVSTTAPGNLTTTALPLTSTQASDFYPYIRPTPAIADFRVGNQGHYLRTATTNSAAGQNYNVDSGFATATLRFEFNTDDPSPVVEFSQTGVFQRLIVDDQFVDLTGFQLGASNTGANLYVKFDFTQGGTYTAAQATKTRNIKIDFNGSGVVGRVVRSSVIYDVFASPVGPKLAIVGDSWCQGVGAALPQDNLATCLADWMGFSDFYNGGVSGSGYLTPPGNTVGTYLERIPDLARVNPNVVVVSGLTNDISALNSATITEAAFISRISNYLTNLRAAVPSIPIVVLSGSIPSQAMLALGQALENDLRAQIAVMQANGDTRIAHVPTIVPTSGGPWIFGSGSDSAPAGDGNRDIYGSSVTAQHLNAGGYNYFGKRGAREVINAIRLMS